LSNDYKFRQILRKWRFSAFLLGRGWELWRIVRYLGGEFFDVPDDFGLIS
jgi:hypothetical protein